MGAHKGFAKVGKWKQTSFADAEIELGKAGELGMFEEIFGDTPEELYLLDGRVKHAGDLIIQCIGDRAGVYVIDGDLIVGGMLAYNQIDGGSALYVTGKLECKHLALGPEANLWVGGDLVVKQHVLGFTGDAGSVIVGGKLTVDTWIDRYGRGTHEFSKKPAIKTFVRWQDEEREKFPKPILAEVALVEAFIENASFEAMTKALVKGKPIVASAADRKKREHAGKEKEAAAGATLELDLSEKHPKAIPAAVFKKPLRKLAIGGWNLAKVPAEIGTMSSLQELAIKSSTDIKTLPASIANLPNLHTLELYRATNIKELPAALVKKNALKALSWGPVDTWPAVIGQLTNLEKLYLWGESVTRMTELPRDIGALTRLKSLALRWQCFRTLPEELLALQDLEELDLWCSLGFVTSLPDLSKLPKLKTLLFSGASSGRTNDPNANPVLLDAIKDLPSLEHLKLYNWTAWKPLKPVLERLATMPALRRLDMKSCAPGGIPDALMRKPGLQELVLTSQTPPLDRARYARDYPQLQISYD